MAQHPNSREEGRAHLRGNAAARLAWGHFYEEQRRHAATCQRYARLLASVGGAFPRNNAPVAPPAAEELDSLRALKTQLAALVGITRQDCECVVCLEPLNAMIRADDHANYMCILNCNHKFHKSCLHNLNRCGDDHEFHCPICRRVVTREICNITAKPVNPEASDVQLNPEDLGLKAPEQFPDGAVPNSWDTSCKACGEIIPRNTFKVKHAKNDHVMVHPKCRAIDLGRCFYADDDCPIGQALKRHPDCVGDLNVSCLFSFRKGDGVRACVHCAKANAWPGARLLGKAPKRKAEGAPGEA